MSTDPDLVRVERGAASDEELAAVTALLIARAGAARSTSSDAPECVGGTDPARWRRLERAPGFRTAHSWQG